MTTMVIKQSVSTDMFLRKELLQNYRVEEYMVKGKTIKKLIIYIFGVSFIIYAFNFFWLEREITPFIFNFILITCVFLFTVTSTQKILLGNTEITKLDSDQACHYHSTVMNIVLGYSAVVGIGITLIWPEAGTVWKYQITWMLIILTVYFIAVMYAMYLWELQKQINKSN